MSSDPRAPAASSPGPAGADRTTSDDDTVATIVATARRIAVRGAADDPSRPSHRVMRTLLEVGYDVVPVTPRAQQVLGITAVPTLQDLEEPVDLVNVFRRAEHAPEVAREAVRAGAWALWLQQGIRSPEARRVATDAGLHYVEDRCLGVVVDRERHRHDAP